MDPSEQGHARTQAVVLTVAALALLSVLLFRAFTLAPSFDGAMNLQVAWSVAQGDGYARSYADRAPFPREIQTNGPYILVAAAGYRLFGMGVPQSQLANAFFLLVLAAAAFVLARKVRGRAADGFAAALLLLATPGLLAYGFRGFGEVPGLALALGGLALYPWAEPGARGRATVAAVLLGAAAVTKTVMLVCVAPVGLVMALHALSCARAPAARATGLALLAAGFVAPIIVWECYRLWSLGGAEAYSAWWALEYASISREAGIAETPGREASLWGKLGQHVGMLSRFAHLPPPLAAVWLLSPFVLAALFPPPARHARWILLATLAAAAAYMVWWLALTPTPKAWHRRIFNGMVLVNIAWALVASAMAADTGRRFRRQAVAVVAVAAACFAANFLVQSRMHGALRPVDATPIIRAVEALRSLPADAAVYATGWSSAPQISLLANRPLLDINDTPADRLMHSSPAYLVVDQEGGHTAETRRVLATYANAPLVTQNTLPQIYRFDPARLAAEPEPADLSARADFNQLQDTQLLGFHKAESHGRWASADAALSVPMADADTVVLEIFVMPPERYADGALPRLALSLGDCDLPPVQTHAGLQKLEFPVDNCPIPDEPATVRIRSSALLDSPITMDERPMAFIAKSIQTCQRNIDAMRIPTPARLLPAALALALTACGSDTPTTTGQQATETPTPTAPAAAEQTLPWSLDEAALASNVLEGRRQACAPEPYSAEVSWRLQPSHGPQPEIWVASPGQPPKLWVAPSQREGAKSTGNWLTDATTLYLVDAVAGSVIARLRMSEVSCSGSTGQGAGEEQPAASEP